MKKHLTNGSTICVMGGIAIYAGALLFGAGTLTVLGWFIAVPMFAGAVGHVALGVYNYFPKGKKVGKDEKEGIKPGLETVGAES